MLKILSEKISRLNHKIYFGEMAFTDEAVKFHPKSLMKGWEVGFIFKQLYMFMKVNSLKNL